jgi:hypothetical protein
VVRFSESKGISIEFVMCNVQFSKNFTKVHFLTTTHYIFGYNLADKQPNFENRTTDSQVMAKYVMCSGQ